MMQSSFGMLDLIKKKNRNMQNSFLHKLKLQFNVNKFHL